jgi:membrane peptidoglycan carboxypeptidase
VASANSPKKYVSSVQKLVQKALKNIKRVLVFIGKPFYLALFYLIYAFLYTFYITGRIFRELLLLVVKLIVKAYLSNSPLRRSFNIFLLRSLETISDASKNLLSSYSKRFKGLKKDIFRKLETSFYALLLFLLKSGGRLIIVKDLFLLKIINLSKERVKTSLLISKKISKKASFISKLLQKNYKKFKTTLFKKSRKVISWTKYTLLKTRLVLIKKTSIKINIPRVNKLVLILSVFFISVVTLLASLFLAVTHDLPSPEELTKRDVEVSTKIYDRNGVLLYKIYKDQNRTPVNLEDLPAQVKLATLAIEDAEFYTHPGFSIKGIIRATIENIKEGELAGGSTITQQLVKNALLTPEKTITRKLKEIVLAVQVELTYTKDEILEMYLNEVAYGGTAYGIQEAAQVYFGKDAKNLSLSEAAFLAGLPKSPTKYSPFGSNPKLAKDRQKEVLNLMAVNGYITKQQAEDASKEKLKFSTNITDIKAPHFVMYTKELLVKRYGEEVVEKGGLEVITTLDYNIQILAEKAVKEEVEKLANLNVGNGAAVVLDPQTGEILAMVGSKDYFDNSNDGNVNVTVSLRQPGSSIKVINYAYALSHNYTPASILKDTPASFAIAGQPLYKPKNYDGRFRGNLSLRSAFAESRNVPAVKVLASYGVANMIKLGKRMGITTWENPNQYGLSLTLGGGEVKLIDLAQVYATVANYGERPDINPILKVTNYKNTILEETGCTKERQKNSLITKIGEISSNTVYASNESALIKTRKRTSNCVQQQVLDPRVAYLLIDILKDNSARAPAFGSNSLLVIPNHPEVAVKTGTSNNLRDNLTVGFNQDYLVAVWVGNNDNSPMSRVASGVTGATPIFNKILSGLITNNDPKDWHVPDGIVKTNICSITGTLPCENCPTKQELFLEEKVPKFACNPEMIKQAKEKDGDKISVNQ